MSEVEESEAVDTCSCCAFCGIADIDNLVPCDDCDLVKYCGDECRENHKSEHEEECKQRAAELRDELLFKQPESTHMGDCPICSLPMPLDMSKISLKACCSKRICKGCAWQIELRLGQKCPFCREPTWTTKKEYVKRMMKRVEMNDPVAIYQHGLNQYGKGDYSRAFEYWSKAAELGNVEAHYALADLYHSGKVKFEWEKGIHLLEKAAIGGHPDARYSLGRLEWNHVGNFERAVKHWIIAATQGDDRAIKELLDVFRSGRISKEELATTLRAHKAAVDGTKSQQREEAQASSDCLPFF